MTGFVIQYCECATSIEKISKRHPSVLGRADESQGRKMEFFLIGTPTKVI
jgi:hypothetical protein